MKNRPSISDEEIRSYMNFDSVVNQFKSKKTAKRIWKRNTSLLLGISGIALLVYFYWPDSSTAADSSRPAQESLMLNDSIALEKEPINALSEINQGQESSTNEYSKAKTAEKIKKTIQPVQEKLEAPSLQYLEAEPVEGYPNLYEYFASELRYPVEALKDSIQGIVSVSFLIDRNGKPVQIKIVNSLGPAFDEEAQRLIENMPAWKPARMNGKAVAAKISLPFTFQIVKANPEKK